MYQRINFTLATRAFCRLVGGIVIDHLDENRREMLHVALNRIGECGDWDLEILGPLLIDLGEIGFDLEATGFSLPELDIIMTPEISSQYEDR